MAERSWIQTQLRGLFASINYCIYSLVQWIIQGMFDIANLESNFTLMEEVRGRIYVILGVFMIFRLTISLINYMVNPDAAADKERGASKLVIRTITMCAFLIVLPFGFEKLRQAQEVFLPVLPKVLLGQNKDNSDTVKKNAESMAVAALRAFYRPCDICETEVDMIDSISDMNSTYADAYDREIVKKVDGKEEKETKNIYDYDFNYIFAAVVGVIMILILLGITLSVAVRVFKLFLLEMLAPIPIISYIDPKSSKSGAFSAWTKQVIMTFVDIFIKLGLMYIVMYLMSKFTSNGTDALFDFGSLKKSEPRYLYLQVFLILGLLLFAKDAPKFVKDALGIKDSGNKGLIDGTLGAITGGTVGAVSGAVSGRGLAGAATGAAAGVAAGYDGGRTGKGANAWRAGGNAAAQARKGDPNAKSGILAAIGAATSHAQGKRMAAKYGITEESLAIGDMDAKSKEAYAQMKEMQYNEAVNNGTATPQMRQEVIAAKAAAAKASAKYKKAESTYEKFTGGASVKSKYQATKKSAAKDRSYIQTAAAIDRRRAAKAGPNAQAGTDYATINDPNKSMDQLYDGVDQRRTVSEAASDMFKDPIDKKRNDSNYNPYS